MPVDLVTLLRLVLLPDLRLFLEARRRDRAELFLRGHATLCHHVQHRRMDVREQLQSLDGAHRKIARVGDRLLIPPAFLQVLDAAPDVDAGHGCADQILRQRDHRNRRVVTVVFDQHVDRRKLRGDRGLHATTAGLDNEFAVRLVHHGRLDDADRFDRGDELLVHRGWYQRAAGIVRVWLERPRIDAPEFGHGMLLVWIGTVFRLLR